jgi:DNA-binding transcriptional MerR regulator
VGKAVLRTVHEVSELTGVSVRALHHYDAIGLLCPSTRTDAGYRLYGAADLERLQHILLFRELEFPLKEIGQIIDNPGFDQSQALEQQIRLLELRREHIDKLLDLARAMKTKGMRTLAFDAFDTSKIEEYAAQAKATWGASPEWKEYERKSKGRTKGDERAMGEELMELFKPFGRMAAEGVDPASPEAVAQARLIQSYITDHFYTCSDEVFLQLGRSYGCGGDFTRNIDAAAGNGAGVFAMHAVEAAVCR